jgi:hypothetical protein
MTELRTTERGTTDVGRMTELRTTKRRTTERRKPERQKILIVERLNADAERQKIDLLFRIYSIVNLK